MALTSNPSKTRTIEVNWTREINRRWAEFKKRTIAELKRANGMASGQITNRGEIFALDPSQQRAYMVFLQNEIDRLLMGSIEAPNWQARYQAQAYERGINATRASLIAAGASIIPTEIERLRAGGLRVFSAVPSIGGITSQNATIHQDALAFLHNRSFEKLRGWTDAMASETRQILFDGLEQGDGVLDVAERMVQRQGVSRTRARVIARTETIQAYQISATNEAERASIELDEEVLMRWISATDGRVRHLHARWHGTVTTIQENRRRIGVSPWNCRCAPRAVIAETNTQVRQTRFDAERKKILQQERFGRKKAN